MLFTTTKHNMRICRGKPLFPSYKTTLKQQLKGEKWDVRYVTAFLLRFFLLWCPVFGRIKFVVVVFCFVSAEIHLRLQGGGERKERKKDRREK